MLQHRLFPARVALLWLALISAGHAAELGEARVQSFVGQALRAEVELLGVSADDARNLTVRQASPDIYKQANVRPDPALASLRLTVEQRDGRTYLRATSATPVDAPYLHVFVELPSGSQHVVRAYTFWLAPAPPGTFPDPPPPVASAPAKPVADKPKAKTAIKLVAKPAKPQQAMLTDDEPAGKTAAAGAKPALAAAEKVAEKTPAKAGEKAADTHGTPAPAKAALETAAVKPADKHAEAPQKAPEKQAAPASVKTAEKTAEKPAEKPVDKHAEAAPPKTPDPHGAAPVKAAAKHGEAAPARPVDKAVDKAVDKTAAHAARPALALAAGKTPDGCPAQFSPERIQQCLVAETENAAINAHLGALEVTVAKLKQAILEGGPVEASRGVPPAASAHATAVPPEPAAAHAGSASSDAHAGAAPVDVHAVAAPAPAAVKPAKASAASSGGFLKLSPLLDKSHANDWIWKIAAPAALSAIALFGGLLYLLKRRAKAKAGTAFDGALDAGDGGDGQASGGDVDASDDKPAPKSKRGKRAAKSKSGPGLLAKIKQFFGKIGRSKKKAAIKAEPTDATEAE